MARIELTSRGSTVRCVTNCANRPGDALEQNIKPGWNQELMQPNGSNVFKGKTSSRGHNSKPNFTSPSICDASSNDQKRQMTKRGKSKMVKNVHKCYSNGLGNGLGKYVV